MIMDTISDFLNIESLQMGASSHSNDWTIVDENVIRVTFQDILLVDINANEPLSHGFFRYRIEQKPNNQAAIYFDYNSPIFTNTTFHTVGEDFVTVIYIANVYDENITVKVFPNPFSETTTVFKCMKTFCNNFRLICN